MENAIMIRDICFQYSIDTIVNDYIIIWEYGINKDMWFCCDTGRAICERYKIIRTHDS